MEFDEETIRQILLALGVVVAFVAGLVGVSQSYGTNGTTLSETGGLAMVGLLAGFILLMAAVGLWLERQDFDSD